MKMLNAVIAPENINQGDLDFIQVGVDLTLNVFGDAPHRLGNAAADGSGGVAVSAHEHAFADCILIACGFIQALIGRLAGSVTK